MFLVLAILVSPNVIPVIADWLVKWLHSLNYTLQGFRYLGMPYPKAKKVTE